MVADKTEAYRPRLEGVVPGFLSNRSGLDVDQLLNNSTFDFVQRTVIAAPVWSPKQNTLLVKLASTIRFTSSTVTLSRN